MRLFWDTLAILCLVQMDSEPFMLYDNMRCFLFSGRHFKALIPVLQHLHYEHTFSNNIYIKPIS